MAGINQLRRSCFIREKFLMPALPRILLSSVFAITLMLCNVTALCAAFDNGSTSYGMPTVDNEVCSDEIGYSFLRLLDLDSGYIVDLREVKIDQSYFNLLLRKARSGDVKSQIILGGFYLFGLGVPKKHDEAFKWFRKAAEKGNDKAQCVVGKLYEKGIGVTINKDEAVRWYSKSIESGNNFALMTLAYSYYYPQTTSGTVNASRDFVNAFKLFKLGAEKGIPLAQYHLAEMYERGLGTAKNLHEALKWYEKAAAGGITDARSMLKFVEKRKKILSVLIEPFRNLTFFGFLGLLIGVFGIIYAYKSKKEKKPCYSLRNFSIVRNFINDVESLQMLYAGERIENVTLTRVAFWNAGRDTIRREDVVPSEPLRLIMKGNSKILDVRILYSKEPANTFRCAISEDRKSAEVDFDYIDKNEGIVLHAIHSSGSTDAVGFTGKIKGAGRPRKRQLAEMTSYSKRTFLFNTIVPAIMVVVFSLAFCDIAPFEFLVKDFLGTIFALLFLLISLVVLIISIISYLKHRPPKGFPLF